MGAFVQRALAGLLAVLLFAACARAPVDAAAPSPRVVSLTPAATAIIDALGARDHLVGVTRYCNVTGVPVVGGIDARPEAVLARRPDLVVIGDYPSQNPLRVELEALHVPVDAPLLIRVADLRAAILHLGDVLGRAPRATALVAALDAGFATARARAARRRAVRVLLVYEVAQGYVYTSGGGDHLDDVLAANGAVNIAAGGPLTTRLALDAVLARAPDLILHAAPNATFPDDAAALAYWKNLADLPAVRAGHVAVWPDDHLAQNGPWIGDSAVRLADLLDRVAPPEAP